MVDIPQGYPLSFPNYAKCQSPEKLIETMNMQHLHGLWHGFSSILFINLFIIQKILCRCPTYLVFAAQIYYTSNKRAAFPSFELEFIA